jgi:hypothetical protein
LSRRVVDKIAALEGNEGMTEFEKKVFTEARLLCRAHCRALRCEQEDRCINIWPGPGGTLSIYFKEAKERALAKMMDTA